MRLRHFFYVFKAKTCLVAAKSFYFC